VDSPPDSIEGGVSCFRAVDNRHHVHLFAILIPLLLAFLSEEKLVLKE
jgi:hypothetical protein